MLDGEFGDFLQFFDWLNRTGWVGREIQHDHSRFVGDCSSHVFCLENKFVFNFGLNRDGLSIGHDDARAVTHVAGLVINHFVAGIQKGTTREVEGFGNADGYENFLLRIVGDIELAGHVFGNGFSKRKQPEV